MKVIHAVSMSGGKDSTATGLLALSKHPLETLRFVFADTGNEHELVYEYLIYLQSELGIKIDTLKADFSVQIANKRKFIENDTRDPKAEGRRQGWSDEAKARALKVLHPTGNPYLDLCLWKGRFPSRRAQFCTQFLKVIPLTQYQHQLLDEGYEVVSWQGVRRDESPNRANVLAIEQTEDEIWQYRPIADWTAEDVFAYHKQHGIDPNPLYKLGMTRVGCMPCINCGKNEIREIANRFPGHIDRIEEWERLISLASKRGKTSFFTNLDREAGLRVPDIRARVEWAKTTRGGQHYDLLAEGEPEACASAYGLCE